MDLIEDLRQRNLLQNITDEDGLRKLLSDGMVTLYAGYDPTSDSLHVGNLVPTIMLKRFQLAGHKPIVLVGGATGMIGDPSGKSEERNLLDDATIAKNIAGISAQFAKLMQVDSSPTSVVMTNNADWTRGVSFLEFLRDTGKYLTINYMMAKDSVKSRLEGDNGISYTEFSYMLLQAFDFVSLSKSHDCRLQVGGNDQYGNITAGCELSRKQGNRQLYGLTAPLLLDSSGQKMGKTSTGERIWLDAARTPPYAFYQYWFNRSDEEVSRLLKMFSLRPLAEITELLATHDADRSKRVGQRELARAMTSWVHGEASITAIEGAAKVMFGGSLEGITEATLHQLVGTIPTHDVARADLDAGIGIVDLLAKLTGDSKGAARRLVQQGGASVNNVKVGDVEHKVTLAHLATESMLVVRSGKKDYFLVRVV